LLGNIIYVGLVTLAQKRLDWMLGYSSVMHMGYIFRDRAEIFSSINGAAILIFAHDFHRPAFRDAGEVPRAPALCCFRISAD
jgi:NADH:ubiquinone oxidoreductase subunit 4 (subunit M)